jgi:O-antigen/teichoic acid export membrane protein
LLADQLVVSECGVEVHESVSPHSVARDAVHGVVVLGFRQILTTAISCLGGILLARLLSPVEFGIYAIVTFLLGFLSSFGDAGLAASLVRQPHEPLEGDYRAVFTAQQLIVVCGVILGWLAAPWITASYHLPARDCWVFRLVALSLLCTSFQVIPASRLERHMSFDKLARVEVAMSFAFFGTAVMLAWRGFGALAFGVAMLARALTGAILVNQVSPWRIGWRWDWARAREHLRFGVAYQGINILSLLRDSITPVFVGLLLGAGSLGYVNWAAMVAFYPVLALLFMYRMYLPAFARLQQQKESLGHFVEQVLRAVNGLVAPAAILTLVCVEPLTRFVFGEKWLVALPLFYLFWTANIFVPTTTPLLALLNALGDSRTPFKFSLAWMLVTWGLGVPLISVYGTIGLAIAKVCVGLTSCVLFRVVQTRVNFRILPMVAPPWCVATVMGVAIFFMMRLKPPTDLVWLGIDMALGLSAYALSMLGLYRSDVRKVWALVLSQG